MVDHGLFREDLYYRLNVFPLHILPLRQRPDDILPLAREFLKQLNERYNGEKQFSAEVLRQLQRFEWTGNVRELKNCVEQAFILSESDTIHISDLRMDLHGRPAQRFSVLPRTGRAAGAVPGRIEYKIY